MKVYTTDAAALSVIRDLRELGGAWKAERYGFGWRYVGVLNGVKYELDSYAHMAPRYDGDDESFVVLWHLRVDGRHVLFPSRDPVNIVRMEASAQQEKRMTLEEGC